MRYSLDEKNSVSLADGHPNPPHSPSAAPHTSMTRSRPASSTGTSMTPDPKRNKTTSPAAAVLLYPEEVPVPSRRTVAAMYKTALKQENGNDQEYLRPAGLLSLEEVLLPALGLQEENILKQLQAKVQRDCPEYKPLVEDNRRLVRKAILRAMEAVQKSRVQRCQQQQERRQMEAEERRLDREARARALAEKRKQEALERKKQRHLEFQEHKRALKKQYPRNQALWKEVVFLTSSITQLEKEERMWIEAEQHMVQKQVSLSSQKAREKREDNGGEQEQQNEEEVIIAPKHVLQEETETMLQDIAIASTRIQTGLGEVLNILKDAEKVRKDMYRKYKEDHQFQGYQKVHDPKSMIRFLSQDDE